MKTDARTSLLAAFALAGIACADTSGLGLLDDGDASTGGSGGASTGGTGGNGGARTGGTGGSATGGAGGSGGSATGGMGGKGPDAGTDARVCPDIVCAAPPAGCRYAPDPKAPCSCGTLACSDGGVGDAPSGDICITFGACYTLEREYVVAVESGRVCVLGQPSQCLHKVDSYLGCPSCETWVNTRDKADAIRKQYGATGCDRCRRACPAIRCAGLTRGACLDSRDPVPGPAPGASPIAPPYSPPPLCAEARATTP